jgi:hypothetical protein
MSPALLRHPVRDVATRSLHGVSDRLRSVFGSLRADTMSWHGARAYAPAEGELEQDEVQHECHDATGAARRHE